MVGPGCGPVRRDVSGVLVCGDQRVEATLYREHPEWEHSPGTATGRCLEEVRHTTGE